MRARLQLALLGLATTLAGCSIDAVTFLSYDAGVTPADDAAIERAPDANADANADATSDAAPTDTVDAAPTDTVDATPADAVDDTADGAPADAVDDMVDATPADAVDDGVDGGCPGSDCAPVCGDGQMQPGEECDDGNTTNGDTCEANCTLPRCGNAILDRNERCDDGTETASCNANCTVSACGDGFLNRQAGETCDDGVNTGASSCDAKCQVLGCSASDEVPAMTDPASPSGLVSRSGAYDPFDEAWQAFDANNATTWISAPRETPAWISYEWQDGPRPITSYAITYVDHIDGSTSRAPQDWTFEGWDGMGWVVLDTRSAETDWVAFQRRVYTVTSPGNYGMYRLDITDDNDPDPGVLLISIGSLDLMGCPP